MDNDHLDDSFNDPNYEEKQDSPDLETSLESDIYEFDDGSEICNPFDKSSSNESLINPFETEVASKLPSECSDSENLLNSTEIVNPFSESSPMSSSKNEPEGKECPHCGKKFTSSYNMKQHKVSIHKIFPPDMKIFTCDFKNCNFATGSRVQFTRHGHSKSPQVEEKASNTTCPQCHEKFFNSSSMKRHVLRKHKA